MALRKVVVLGLLMVVVKVFVRVAELVVGRVDLKDDVLESGSVGATACEWADMMVVTMAADLVVGLVSFSVAR